MSGRRTLLVAPTMRTMTRCLLLALLIAGLGLALRGAVPVTPVDGAFRSVLQAYATPGPGPGPDRRQDQQHE
jgi:hypothetical protein